MSISNCSSDHHSTKSLETTLELELTNEQKLRIEENKKKALSRKRQREEMEKKSGNASLPRMNSRLSDLFLSSKSQPSMYSTKCAEKVISNKLIDTGGGFLLDESEMSMNKPEEISVVSKPPAILPPDQPKCLECGKDFSGSYLFEKFDHPVCDDCRDPEEKHALITKTEAKKNYILTDVDLEQRGTCLKFILGKNPHNSRWSGMKLYLLLQVEKRALEIWGSEDKLLEELEKREEKRSKTKQKAYKKKMKALKMSVRSSLYTRSLTESHQHQFGNEIYNSIDDTYSHSCLTCSFTETYERM